MRRLRIILTMALLTGALSAIASEAKVSPAPETLSLSALEQRLIAIDAELEQLSQPSLRTGDGTQGYRSQTGSTLPIWVEIQLERAVSIDQIVLAPVLWRGTKSGFQADGFPLEFRIMAGAENDRKGTLIREVRSTDNILPRVAPLTIPAGGITASWVRIEVTRLSQRTPTSPPTLQLSEMLIFSGEENVALRRPVSESHAQKGNAPLFDKQFLTDGLMPYVMDTTRGERSNYFVSKPLKNPSFTLDLGEKKPLSRIHLHTKDQGNTFPGGISDTLGFPRNLLIEGATRPDFSDAISLLEFRFKKEMDIGPIMMWNIPETPCRYVRLSSTSSRRLSFAEIELFSKGRNVALGRPVKSPSKKSAKKLTDGLNFYGEIISIRDWMNELARRHDLETERPLVSAEVNRRYVRQKTIIKRMRWLAAGLLVGTVIIVLATQVLRQRAVFNIRNRIAANLHDELGANLHAIGLLGDTAKKVVDQKNAANEWPDLIEIVGEIRELTEETGSTARHCTNLLEANGLYQNLVADMKRIADRLLADLHHEIEIAQGECLHRLKPRRRIDLILFYKECLTNILRHSGATTVSTRLTADKNKICLTISDNGCGTQGKIPSSLKRRARLLKANLTVEEIPDDDGTKITLTLRPRRGLRPSQRSDSQTSKVKKNNVSDSGPATFRPSTKRTS